jgi:hypothetical protein
MRDAAEMGPAAAEMAAAAHGMRDSAAAAMRRSPATATSSGSRVSGARESGRESNNG